MRNTDKRIVASLTHAYVCRSGRLLGEGEAVNMNLRQIILRHIRCFWKDEQGQDMVEYALLLAFIALATTGLLTGVKTQIKGLFSTISSTLSSTNASAS